jgi:3-dehydroquinate synthase
LAAQLSERLGLIGPADVLRLRALLHVAGLPVDAPRLGAERYLSLMGRDKKVVAGSMRFVLLRALGQAFVAADVPERDLIALFEAEK